MYRKTLKTILVALILSMCAFTFVACGPQTHTESIYDGDTVVKTYENLPTNSDLENIAKPGYIFEGAYYDKEFTDEFNSETFGKLNADLTLYLKYEKQSFIVQVNSNGGTAVSPVLVYYDTAYEIPAPTKQGYTFAGYTLDGEDFPTTGTYTKTNGIKLFANWTINSYEVKFLNANDNNAQIGDTLTQEYNTKITSLPTVANGYEIENGKVYSDAECTQEVNLSTYKVTENANLYVKVKAKQFTISINKNGGDNIAPVSVTYNAPYELVAAPTRTGYTFTGYTLNGEPFALTGTYTLTSNITIDANWQAIPGFNDRKVMFYDGSTELTDYEIDAVVGQTIKAATLPTPTKAGYDFAGWYTTSALETLFTETVISSDLTLYAKFVAKTFTIEIVTNNGTQVSPVTVTYGTVPTLPTLTKNGYKFVKFVEFGTSVTFDATANYNKATNTIIEAVWDELEVEFGENSNEDQYNLVKTENYFKEKSHYNEEGEYTYVFIKGIPYSFSGMTISSSSNLVNIQNNGFTATTVGTFKLTISKVVDDTPVTYVRNAKVVENVASFNVNETRNAANFNSNTLVEAMSVGTANGYKPDITIKNVNDAEIGFGDGNVIISATNVKNNDVIYLDTADYNAATGFNLIDLTVGETYEFSFIPKYYVGGNTATIKVTINDGVNVYTNAELRSAFANLAVHKINVLRDIKAELVSDQYDNGNVHNPYHVLYNTNTKIYQWTDGFSVAYNQDGTINTDVMKNGWVYSRSTVGTNDSITINGNSFKLDASTLPRVNGGIANTWVTFANMAPGTERVVNQHAFIFSYMSHKPNDINTAVNNGNTFNVNDLAIYGNNTLASDTTTKYGKDGESYYEMSASYNSLRIMGGNLNATNVAIRNSLISFFISGDSDTVTEGANGYATKAVLDNCYAENSWANSICTFYLTHLTVQNSIIKNSGGAAIHFDCAPYPGVSTQNSTLVLENTQISNWVLGTESWLTAYQMSPTALAIKAQLEQGLNEKGLTCIKNIEGKGQAFNFAIFYQKIDADNTAGWDKMNVGTDYQGKPYVDITNTSKSWATGLSDEQIQGALGMPPSYIPHWYTHTADIGVSVGLMLPVRPTYVHPQLGQDVFGWTI